MGSVLLQAYRNAASYPCFMNASFSLCVPPVLEDLHQVEEETTRIDEKKQELGEAVEALNQRLTAEEDANAQLEEQILACQEEIRTLGKEVKVRKDDDYLSPYKGHALYNGL